LTTYLSRALPAKKLDNRDGCLLLAECGWTCRSRIGSEAASSLL